MSYKEFLHFAQNFRAKNREMILKLWQDPDLETELKEDKTPVTKLDKQIEMEFRVEVKKAFPNHGVLGEEFGLDAGAGEFTWVIDPIDGTQSLVNRVPTFGTFIALLHSGDPVLGVIDIPVLDRFAEGAVGLGVRNETGKEILLSAPAPFSPNDIIAIGTTGSFIRGGDQASQIKLQNEFQTTRAYYDSFGHYLVACGGVAGLVEMNVPAWDVVAVEALVKAAAGTVWNVKKDQNLLGLRSAVAGRKEVVEKIRTTIAY